jgi:DEAD_2
VRARTAGEFTKARGHEVFTIAAVASRKVLCVNPRVSALKAAWRVNDACLELQSKAGSKKQALSGA